MEGIYARGEEGMTRFDAISCLGLEDPSWIIVSRGWNRLDLAILAFHWCQASLCMTNRRNSPAFFNSCPEFELLKQVASVFAFCREILTQR